MWEFSQIPCEGGLWDGSTTFAGAVFGGLVEALLETGDLNIEAENLNREGMLGEKAFRATDSLLPWILRHGAIMGLGPGRRQMGPGYLFCATASPALTSTACEDYSL